MPHRDLREYLSALEAAGLLRRVECEVDPELEAAEILRRVMYSRGPAVLFERVRGFPGWRIAGNIFGTPAHFRVAFGVDRLEEIGERTASLLSRPPPMGLGEKVRALGEAVSLARCVPKRVPGGPVKEVRLDPLDGGFDLIPALKTWPKDAGRFLTFPLVFSRDPETGVVDVGVYRMQIYDRETAGMHWHVHKRGAMHLWRASRSGSRELEVAVVIGADPATTFAGVAPVPHPMDKLLFAGLVRGEGVEVVRADTCDIYVPARAEVVLEGYVRTDELRVEGPFGDHTGYYTPPEPYPVFHLERITMRRDPIYHATVVGRPPLEDAQIGKAIERVFLPLVRVIIPEVVDLNLPEYGLFQGVAIVSIAKRYPGQAKKVMMGLWGLGQFSLTKVIVVVDEDVDVHDLNQVLYAVATCVDPARDVLVVEGAPTDALDHAAPSVPYGSKLGIDATRKLPEEMGGREWPEPVEPDPETVRLVDERWPEYGLN